MNYILERRHERGFLGVLVMFGFLSWVLNTQRCLFGDNSMEKSTCDWYSIRSIYFSPLKSLKKKKKLGRGASLAVQWLRLCLPM